MTQQLQQQNQFKKLTPQNIGIEETVLGAIMLDADAMGMIVDILNVGSFYKPANQLVFQAMLDLFSKTNPIDLETVAEQLRKNENLEDAGGPYYLVELTNKVASAANIEYHARILTQYQIQREVITASTEAIKMAYDPSVDFADLLDKVEQNIFDIGSNCLNKATSDSGQIMSEVVKYIEKASEQKDGLTGVPTGFTDLDRLTGGWQEPDLIIVAARPGMGKTAFTLAVAKNAAMDYGKGVAIFSLEMSKVQLGLRLVSMESDIAAKRVKDGKLDEREWQEITNASEKISSAPIFIDDTPAINIFELRAKARRLKMQHDISMVVVDYLQLMTGVDGGKSGNREQEISAISRGLKGLAKELNIPVIALSQLSRAVETRGGDKRPQLSDLRESGAIEQDADIVSFIYRPEYYNVLEDAEGQSLKGVGEIIVAKHRSGELATVKLKFDAAKVSFKNLDEPNFNELLGGEDDRDFPEKPPSNIITIDRSSRMNDDDIPF